MEQNAQPAEGQARPEIRTRPRRNSRRKALTTGLGVAAATVGAGALLELSSGTASASSIKPGVFASSVGGTPAVKATGTNGADGVDATSDSGTGVSATSSSGTGLVATSSSGLAGHFVGGDVDMDKNLTVTGALSTGTLSSGAGTLASSVGGTPAVKATGTNGADGVLATSDIGNGVSGMATGTGTGVFAQSTGRFGLHAIGGGASASFPQFSAAVFAEGGTHSGVVGTSSSFRGVEGDSDSGDGVVGISKSGQGVSAFSASGSGVLGTSTSRNGVVGESSSATLFFAGVHGINANGTGTGLAGLFDGDVQVNGNFSATGTKSFVQAHPTDPSREIVYVALEGGEAGTYVRGTGQLVNGKAVIALPEHFGLVTAYEGLTIQLTSRGEWLQLYLVELDPTQAVVREAQGKSGAFDYLIHGVRRGYEQHEVLRTKR